MEERARYNPAEALLPESLDEEGSELVTVMPHAGGIRDVESVLYVLYDGRRDKTAHSLRTAADITKSLFAAKDIQRSMALQALIHSIPVWALELHRHSSGPGCRAPL